MKDRWEYLYREARVMYRESIGDHEWADILAPPAEVASARINAERAVLAGWSRQHVREVLRKTIYAPDMLNDKEALRKMALGVTDEV